MPCGAVATLGVLPCFQVWECSAGSLIGIAASIHQPTLFPFGSLSGTPSGVGQCAFASSLLRKTIKLPTFACAGLGLNPAWGLPGGAPTSGPILMSYSFAAMGRLLDP